MSDNTLPTALVTGADRGFGFCIARRLAQAGWRVFAGRVLSEYVLLDRLHDEFPEVRPIRLGVSSQDELHRAKEEIGQISGKLDLLVSNAAIMGREGDDPFYGAPVVLIVLARKDAFTGIYDGSLVMENLMLAAHSLGLGSIWIHRAKEEFETEEYKKILRDLGAEGEYEGVGHCAIGYADCPTPGPAPRKDGRVFYI